jgi:biopolymer transport protein TolR
MGMSVRPSGKVKSEPNVVPMIDIMLVLLIIFMLIIPQVNSGFDSEPPKGVNLIPQKEEDQDQVLGIDKGGGYYWNKIRIPNESLADTVNRIYTMRAAAPVPDYTLFIRADKTLEYGKVLDALDIVSKNKVRLAAMISEQEAGTESSVAADRALLGNVAPAAGGGQ